MPPATGRGETLGALACVLASLLALHAAAGDDAPSAALLLLAAVVLAAAWRRAPRLLAVATAALVLSAGGADVHRRRQAQDWPRQAEARVAERLAGLERRKLELIGLVEASAAQAARRPEVAAALRGDAVALRALFLALERQRDPDRDTPAIAVCDVGLRAVAWSGRIGELAPLRGLLAGRAAVFVLEGSVSTTLFAATPLRGAEPVAGYAVASFPISVRRNIQNDFLGDFDRIVAGDPAIEVRYVDARVLGEAPEAFPPLDPALIGRETILRAADGFPLANVRVTAPAVPEPQRAQGGLRNGLLALLALLVCAAWAMAPLPGLGPHARWLLAASAARGLLLYLGPPLLAPESPLVSTRVYASGLPLRPLLRSPLDLLLTSAWLLLAAGLLFSKPGSRRRPSLPRALLAAVAALPLLVVAFVVANDTVRNSSLDLTELPRGLPHLVLQLALLAVLGAALMLMAALFSAAGPLPEDAARRGVWAALGAVLAAVVVAAWPRDWLGLPLLPALGLLGLAAALGMDAARRSREAPVAPERRAGRALLLLAALGTILYPSLLHFGEKSLRQRIERGHARDVLDQPQRRADVLQDTQRRIDSLSLLEETPTGPGRPGIEELAFWAWSRTELARLGLSSAIELQDAGGAIVSRFALELPSLTNRPLPAAETWRTSREQVPLLSERRSVLHARRLLTYHGEVHGAVHVYVADDYWNLPFLRARDPYTVLYRTGASSAGTAEPILLLAWNRERQPVFTSAPQSPTLDPGRVQRLEREGPFWTTFSIGGLPHHVYLFAGERASYGLAYPRLTAGHVAGDLLEAVSGLVLAGLALLLLVGLARTLLRRPSFSFQSLSRLVRRRFALRLLVAFLVVAAVPVVVLQIVVQRFVAADLWRQFGENASERATLAANVVRDYAAFQRAERSPGRLVSDDVLVWLARRIGNDLEVFERGRLVASSKRELYDSGLLSPIVSGAVYRTLVLDGEASILRPERIGDFRYLVVAVPLPLDGAEPAILSIPVASWERDVKAAVGDVTRTIRFAAVAFLGLAALLAHSMSRRISEPIRALTQATRRVAQGELETRVAVRSGDELEQLVESFNQMAGDLERQRRDLERSNRLAAWAEMARQVAHEIKNPLTPIQLSTEHLRRVWRDRSADFGATLEACTEAILRQVRTLRGIVTEFSAFARPPAPALSPLDPLLLVRDVLAPYMAARPPGVELRLEGAETAPLVVADRRLLERAIVNLVENALQALPETGAITVRVRPTEDRSRVLIEVEDTGPGVDPELRERLFEPFFSTKTGGSGLGLALVKKTAEDQGGGASIESPPAGGTRATIWLPALPAEGTRSA